MKFDLHYPYDASYPVTVEIFAIRAILVTLLPSDSCDSCDSWNSWGSKN